MDMTKPRTMIRNIQLRWAPLPEWRAALPHLVILFGDRFAPET
jgi:hypothetical protein